MDDYPCALFTSKIVIHCIYEKRLTIFNVLNVLYVHICTYNTFNTD